VDGIIAAAGKPPKFVLLKAYWLGVQDLFPEDTWNKLAQEIDKTIAHLKSLGVEQIILVGPSPQFRYSVPDCLMRQTRNCELASIDQRRQAAPVISALSAVLSRRPTVRYIDPAESLCVGSTCPAQLDNALLYYDAHHLTLDGEKLLSRQLAPEVINALAK
jgi:hypothetical protein